MPRVEAPKPAAVAAAALILAGAAACGAQAQDLPDCVWCGTAEAPDTLDATVTIAGEDEPGRQIRITGVVYRPDGETPAPDVTLYLYHTNARGIYPKRGDETGNARRHGYLRGWLKTDEQGRYEIRTIRPGNYPDSEQAQHIHVTVKEPGDRHEYTLPSFNFAGDPFLDADPSAPHVLTLERTDGGVWHGRRDIVLPEAIEAVQTPDGPWYRPAPSGSSSR